MKELGRHLLVELYNCEPKTLMDKEKVKNILLRSTKAMGATIKGEYTYKFPASGGISSLIVIAESHVSAHTWPEHGYAAVDIFTCGVSLDPWKAFNVILQEFNPRRYNVMEIRRGLMDERSEADIKQEAL